MSSPLLDALPLVTFGRIEDGQADRLLEDWQHYLGPCRRPYGRQSWALFIGGEPVSVAVSASTPAPRCAGHDRRELVELARLCSSPDYRDQTRVCLRLWRQIAAPAWPYWQARYAVTYCQRGQGDGGIFRHDGWRKLGTVPGGRAGGRRKGRKSYPPKVVWLWPLPAEAVARCSTKADLELDTGSTPAPAVLPLLDRLGAVDRQGCPRCDHPRMHRSGKARRVGWVKLRCPRCGHRPMVLDSEAPALGARVDRRRLAVLLSGLQAGAPVGQAISAAGLAPSAVHRLLSTL